MHVIGKRIYVNKVSTVHLETSGRIHDFQLIAEMIIPLCKNLDKVF